MRVQPQPSISISPVKLADIDTIARNIVYPAFKDDPLQRVSFHQPTVERMEDEEVAWHRDSLADALRQGGEILFKACACDCAGDGAGGAQIVGVIGWTLQPGVSNEMLVVRNGAPGSGINSRRKGQTNTNTDIDTAAPASLNVAAWLCASRALREERERVLSDYRSSHPGKGICRITLMAVAPAYQRRDVGSALMKVFCEHIDEARLNGFVISSLAGARLYSKFGFQAMGGADIGSGVYTSMLRVIMKA